MDRHLYQLQQWVAERLANVFGMDVLPREDLIARWQVVAGDASARCYYRVQLSAHSVIVMDSSADLNAIAEFVGVADVLSSGGVRVPQIYSQDLAQGYLLLEDFGDDMLKQELCQSSGQPLFDALLPVLSQVATCSANQLPAFGANKLREELALFEDWFLQKHLGVQIAANEQSSWQAFCDGLVDSALEQQQVVIHRDFHSCNLHRLDDGGIGVIDFQDARVGPITYDLASWLWDRYISWGRVELEAWMEQARLAYGVDTESLVSANVWRRHCDWMGLQRNLKIVGIFSRLHYRDEKSGYLEMIPRFASYIIDILPRYSEFNEVAPIITRWLSSTQQVN